MPILSSKSAPGLIIATGIYDQSMKGHPGVYMSRDAGVTWKQVSGSLHYYDWISYELLVRIVSILFDEKLTLMREFEFIGWTNQLLKTRVDL